MMSEEDKCITSREERDGQKTVEEIKDAQSSPSSDSNEHKPYSLKEISILDINSADDVSTEKTDDDDQSKDGVSWQCLSDLPSIQTMTNFLLNTCHNYRQTMKAVLSGKPGNEDLSKCKGDSERTSDTSDTNETCEKEKVAKKNKTEKILEIVPLIKERENEESGPSAQGTQSAPPTRKRGRPPKAGPSKRFKKRRSNMLRELYSGKLRDLVRGVKRSDSESDGEITY